MQLDRAITVIVIWYVQGRKDADKRRHALVKLYAHSEFIRDQAWTMKEDGRRIT